MCERLQEEKTGVGHVDSTPLLAETLNFLNEFTIESDEDSCCGMAFFEGRISEDWFYDLKYRIECLIKANKQHEAFRD